MLPAAIAALAATGLITPFATNAHADGTAIIKKHKDRDHVLLPPPQFHRDSGWTVISKRHDEVHD